MFRLIPEQQQTLQDNWHETPTVAAQRMGNINGNLVGSIRYSLKRKLQTMQTLN